VLLKVVKTYDKLSLFRPAGNGWVSRYLQDQLRLLERVLLTKVAEELKAPDVSWQVVLGV
jgi:hypothetical protein